MATKTKTKLATPEACPVCTQPVDGKPHTDEQCVDALIESGLFASAPWFDRVIPPSKKWTNQEREFARALALQAIRWKKTELTAG